MTRSQFDVWRLCHQLSGALASHSRGALRENAHWHKHTHTPSLQILIHQDPPLGHEGCQHLEGEGALFSNVKQALSNCASTPPSRPPRPPCFKSNLSRKKRHTTHTHKQKPQQRANKQEQQALVRQKMKACSSAEKSPAICSYLVSTVLLVNHPPAHPTLRENGADAAQSGAAG